MKPLIINLKKWICKKYNLQFNNVLNLTKSQICIKWSSCEIKFSQHHFWDDKSLSNKIIHLCEIKKLNNVNYCGIRGKENIFLNCAILTGCIYSINSISNCIIIKYYYFHVYNNNINFKLIRWVWNFLKASFFPQKDFQIL